MASTNNIARFSFSSGGSKLEVIECEYGFSQNYDASNKPSGLPSINLIHLVVRVTNETDLVDWMVTPRAEKDGSIEIDMDKSTKRKIVFKRGFCVNYTERFDNYSEDSYLISMNILAKEISINAISYKAEWEN